MHPLIGRSLAEYRERIFPKVKKVRGSHRASTVLAKTAELGLKKVEEDEIEPINEKEWDNLIILDACRHDLFEKVVGPAESRISVGSGTPEFIEKTFSQGDWSDIVYITANPNFHPSKFRNLTGRAPEDVFATVFHTYDSGWDDEEKTVMPDRVVSDAKTAQKLFPDKRKIIHFMQPHVPFVGPNFDKEFRYSVGSSTAKSVFHEAALGRISHKELVEGYQDNLKFVWPHVEQLAEHLEGETAVTSDHGNFIGEHGLYGHFRDLKAEAIRKVPWNYL